MDINTLIEIATNPITLFIVGTLISKYAPSWIPFLGTGRKVVNELVELHKESKTLNGVIIINANLLKLKKAAKVLEKQFKTKT